ncbi:MAG: photosynthetic reaction center cytochrome c subunit [Gemmatimonadaceae bacterium]|nr:photosynthetic reaction center cytochrome c subunit [Gemmatimonadaceae bacterium]
MPTRSFRTPLIAALAFLACSRGSTSAPAGAPTPTPGPAPTASSAAPSAPVAPVASAAGAAAPGAPGGAPRRRPPDPRVQDSLRKATVATILASIAGHEHESAGKVFKNVKLLGEMPADDFVRYMDEQVGKALGMVCVNCHVAGQWESDSRKNKVIARQMQQLTNDLNAKVLPTIKELDADYHKVGCAMCHRGTGHAENAVPAPATAPPAGAPR